METGQKKKNNSIKVILVLIILVGALVGYYFYLSSKEKIASEDVVTYSAVDEILAKDLVNYYPPTPKEVLTYYAEMTKCFYNEEYSDEQLVELADKICELYDDELVANNEWDGYIGRLYAGIDDFEIDGMTISSYTTSSSMDVEYFEDDGFEWARLYCTFTLRKGSKYTNSNQLFLLRKDDDGHWKIYGWTLVENGDFS